MATRRKWTVKVSWPETGKDLDICAFLTAGSKTSSGVGWNYNSDSSHVKVNSAGVNGTFYMVWGGDDMSSAGSETLTIYYDGEDLPVAGQVATVKVHCHYFGSGDGLATARVIKQNGEAWPGEWTVTPSAPTKPSRRADETDPYMIVPLLVSQADYSSVDILTVSLDAGAGQVSPPDVVYTDPTQDTRYGDLPVPTPPSGYVFDGWYTASSGGSRIDATTKLVSRYNDHTIYARYTVIPRYAINGNAIPSGGGSITGIGYYTSGATCTLTAVANQGYEFVKWTQGVSSVSVSSSPTYSFTVTQSDIYRAFFARKGDGQLIYDDATGRLICADSGELIYHDREILDH